MKRIAFLFFALLTASAWCRAKEEPAPYALKVPMPEFKGIEAWINSKPLDKKSLKGKVVVLHFWAFG
jgi:hypothetical protein